VLDGEADGLDGGGVGGGVEGEVLTAGGGVLAAGLEAGALGVPGACGVVADGEGADGDVAVVPPAAEVADEDEEQPQMTAAAAKAASASAPLRRRGQATGGTPSAYVALVSRPRSRPRPRRPWRSGGRARRRAG
jgi:hypothetical protein